VLAVALVALPGTGDGDAAGFAAIAGEGEGDTAGLNGLVVLLLLL
jgi:hypothetical protein